MKSARAGDLCLLRTHQSGGQPSAYEIERPLHCSERKRVRTETNSERIFGMNQYEGGTYLNFNNSAPYELLARASDLLMDIV
eukprot:6189501-Pleurochrysis_carterae.AAC.1